MNLVLKQKKKTVINSKYTTELILMLKTNKHIFKQKVKEKYYLLTTFFLSSINTNLFLKRF